MAKLTQADKEIVDQYIDAYLEENLPRVVREVVEELIREENLKTVRKYMDPDLKIFGA